MPVVCVTARRSKASACRPPRCLPPATPKLGSPPSWGVARQVVSRWHARWRQGGQDALRSAGPTGQAPRLSGQQLHRIDQALREGARAHGFDNDHWTLVRITRVIKQTTGVAYHPGHTWKLLHHRLHYRLQRPARRAIERDEQAIARWVAEDWP
jgi:transposase